MLTIDAVFQLRNEGRKMEAYEAAREIYAVDKSHRASVAMFWTAIDMLRMMSGEDRIDEAKKIYMALDRLLLRIDDEKGWMHDALVRCNDQIQKSEKRINVISEGPGHLKLGVWGEELAAAYLREKGYVILERDWHSTHRDIDIIAQQADCIVFVEVKTRRNSEFGDPLQAINFQKRRNLRRAINHYLNYHKSDCPWRFDVITVIGTLGSAMPDISHIEGFPLS